MGAIGEGRATAPGQPRRGNRAGATAPGPREVDLSANATMIFGEDDWDDLHRAVEEARMMLEKKS